MRVVAGRLRGRRLQIVSGREVRPTSDRARAGLFDWLGSVVVDARVLDLFAGSGALGIEALSRGARSVVFVERNPVARRILRGNLEGLGLEGDAQIESADVARFLGAPAESFGPFDLILADPPYGEDWPSRIAGAAAIPGILVPGGVLVVERSARDPRPAAGPGLLLRETRSYGETVFDWFDREEEP